MGVSPDTLFNNLDYTIILSNYFTQGHVRFKLESGPIAEHLYVRGFALPEHLGLSYITEDPSTIFPEDALEFTHAPLPMPRTPQGYACDPNASRAPPQHTGKVPF